MTLDWSTWKPGDSDAQSIASSPGWLAEGLIRQRITFPGAENINLDVVASVVSSGLGQGFSESKISRNIVDELNIEKELAKSLAHFAMALAMSQRALGDYMNVSDARIQWDSAGCCESCNKNDGVEINAGGLFPSGHQIPPACSYCICDIMPSLDF